MINKYVQYGCGFSAPESWRNYDSSPTLRFERTIVLGKLYTRNAKRFPKNVLLGDIVSGLPEKDNSCSGVYCSHILEHLSLGDCRVAIRNTYRILKPGGKFRMVLPDLEYEVTRYQNDQSDQASSNFMNRTYLGKKTRNRSLRALVSEWLGNSNHLWMWDYKTLSAELAAAGFTSIRRAGYGDSNDPQFDTVEDEGRWFNALGVECIKQS